MAQLNIPTIAPTINQMVSDLQTQFENQTTYYTTVQKKKNEGFVNGKGWKVPSYFNRPTGITAGTEGFSFNQPGLPRWDEMYIYPAQVALAFELSGRTIRNFNAGSESSQIDGIAEYMSLVAAALTKDIEKNCFGDGSGLRATATSSSGGTLTCASAAAASFGSTKGVVALEIGEVYDVVTAAGVVRGQAKVLTKPTSTTCTVTYFGLVDADVTAGDILVPTGGYFNFPRGLAYLVNNDTGVFQLLSRGTYGQLKANVVDLAGGAITVSDFDQAVSLVEIRGDNLGKTGGLNCWMPVAQHSALTRLGQNLKRFDGTATKFDGSFQEFGFGTVTCAKAVDLDEDRLYFINPADHFCVEEKPFGVYDEDGNEMRMKAGTAGVGSDSWTGAMGIHYQAGSYQPRRNALIKRAAIASLPTQVAAY